jgi:hypothetical protein
MFSLCHHIQTSCGAEPASYPVGILGSLPRVKQLEHEADHSPPSSAEVENVLSLTSLHGVVFS